MKWLKSRLFTQPDAPTQRAQGEVHEANKLRSGGPVSTRGMFICKGTYRNDVGLYLVDQHGKIAAELIRSSAAESLGSFAVSPDARWIAYTCYVRRYEDRDSYPLIRALPAAGGRSTDLTPWNLQYETCYQNPVFSPHGDRIVCEFALRHPYNPDLRVFELFELGDRLTGSGIVSIINPLHIGNHSPLFTPDGKRIIYFSNFAYEDQLEVCLYDPAIAHSELLGEVGWKITENADGVWRRPRAIAFQPQWEQIFFIQGHMRDRERICLFLLSNLPPGAEVKFFDSVGGEHNRIGALEMSIDGLRLAYDADGAIYIVESDGSKLRRISKEGVGCRCPRFAEDGARIAFVADGKLCVADCDGNDQETFANDELRVDEFIWA